ncbi:MAG: phosphoribosylaminoimidazole carboxylase [Polaribacter sp.]
MFKKIAVFLSFFAFLNCSDSNNLSNCIKNVPVNISTDLNNPQLINALTPGGFAELPGGLNGILLLNVNGKDFVAYDRKCPVNDCNTPMIFEKGIFLKCPCDGSEYGVGKGIGGAPQTKGFNCPAIEYRVIKRGTSIRIGNF